MNRPTIVQLCGEKLCMTEASHAMRLDLAAPLVFDHPLYLCPAHTEAAQRKAKEERVTVTFERLMPTRAPAAAPAGQGRPR